MGPVTDAAVSLGVKPDDAADGKMKQTKRVKKEVQSKAIAKAQGKETKAPVSQGKNGAQKPAASKRTAKK